jgi:hypothetical protein
MMLRAAYQSQGATTWGRHSTPYEREIASATDVATLIDARWCTPVTSRGDLGPEGELLAPEWVPADQPTPWKRVPGD